MFGRYTKAIVGTVAGIATWGVTAGADGSYTHVELWGLLGIVALALGVAVPKNAPEKPAEDKEEAA